MDVIDGSSREGSALDSLADQPLVRALQAAWRKVQRAERQALEEVSLAALARLAQESGALDFQI